MSIELIEGASFVHFLSCLKQCCVTYKHDFKTWCTDACVRRRWLSDKRPTETYLIPGKSFTFNALLWKLDAFRWTPLVWHVLWITLSVQKWQPADGEAISWSQGQRVRIPLSSEIESSATSSRECLRFEMCTNVPLGPAERPWWFFCELFDSYVAGEVSLLMNGAQSSPLHRRGKWMTTAAFIFHVLLRTFF